MGVYLHNKEYHMEMGYFSFHSLRNLIANIYNYDLFEIYKKLDKCHTEDEFKAFDDEMNTYLETAKLDDDIIEFLFLPDTEGSISYKTCGKLYKIIKDYTSDIRFGYVNTNNTFEYFKEMLLDCKKKKRKLYWD